MVLSGWRRITVQRVVRSELTKVYFMSILNWQGAK